MAERLSSFLGNDSTFGRIMTRLAILIGASLMFAVFCLPVVTIGPALTAMYHVMFRTLRSDGEINPFREFWKGFRSNLLQSLICWLSLAAAAVMVYLDIRYCNYAGGVFTYFKYGLYMIGAILIILALYIFPVISAFSDTLLHQLRNALFFAARRPLIILFLFFLHVLPLFVTYWDEQRRPLYGFLWVTCIPGLLIMLAARLHLKDFEKFLPKPDLGEVDESL